MTRSIELTQWLADPRVASFPLHAVIEEFRRVGKHFVSSELTAALAKARSMLPDDADALRRFLDTALDKHDGRFDNPSYLALNDLQLPDNKGSCPLDTESAGVRRDRLIMLLVSDLLGFELSAHDGTTSLLPMMRPDARITAKRCALGLIALRPVMTRQGLDSAETGDPIAVARDCCARIEATETGDERRMLTATLLTVSTVHDENLFVRVLQSYETAFCLIALELRAAIVALMAGNAARAVCALQTAEGALREVAPLFSLVATMRPEAFMTFRQYTDGASAIQSRSYKTIESLCRRPNADRLAGPGYDAVPEVRDRVLAGMPTIEDALAKLDLRAEGRPAIEAAMTAFETALIDWRRMHHNLAMRMLGLRRGTGYTAGVPYLAEAKDVPVFSCPFAHSAR